MAEFHPIYMAGITYTTMGGVVISFLFAFYRWGSCVSKYVKTGKIDPVEGSLFFGRNNWFYQDPHATLNYYNNPWIIAVDIVFIDIAVALLALIWPISVIVTSIIAYAKIARIRYKRKKEFVDKLKGQHAENNAETYS